MCGGLPEAAEPQRSLGARREEERVPGAYGARPGANRFGNRYRAFEGKQRTMKTSGENYALGRFDAEHSGRADDGGLPGRRSSADDQAEVRAATLRDRATGFPVSLESSAALRRVEEAIAVSPESQMQATSCDQNQRTAVTGVRGELAVSIDISETQTPGKVLSYARFSGDLQSGPSSVPPGHGAIRFVFPDPAFRLLLQVPVHAFLRFAICSHELRIGRYTGAMK